MPTPPLTVNAPLVVEVDAVVELALRVRNVPLAA
jgi:hypothetical protein